MFAIMANFTAANSYVVDNTSWIYRGNHKYQLKDDGETDYSIPVLRMVAKNANSNWWEADGSIAIMVNSRKIPIYKDHNLREPIADNSYQYKRGQGIIYLYFWVDAQYGDVDIKVKHWVNDVGSETYNCWTISGEEAYEWRYKSWSDCNESSCLETRTERCIEKNSGSYVDISNCLRNAQNSRQSTERTCSKCIPEWEYGSWSSCSTSCGSGKKTRNYYCRYKDGSSASESKCSGSPYREKSCSYYTYSWQYDDWSSCNAKCQKTSSAFCERCDGTRSVDGNCSGAKPQTKTQSCSGGNCPKCDSNNLHLCNASNCSSQGNGHWYDNECNEDPEPKCSSSRQDLCQEHNCSSQGDGYWYDNKCNREPEPECSSSRQDLCLEHNCSSQGNGYWYEDRCNEEPGCDFMHLDRCNYLDCINNKWHWYSGRCNINPKEPECDEEHLNLCKNSSDCDNNGGHWYNDFCNINPKANEKPSIEINSHSSNQTIHVPLITIQGTASDSDGFIKAVYVNEELAKGTGNWSQEITLSEGENHICVKAQDDKNEFSYQPHCIIVTFVKEVGIVAKFDPEGSYDFGEMKVQNEDNGHNIFLHNLSNETIEGEFKITGKDQESFQFNDKYFLIAPNKNHLGAMFFRPFSLGPKEALLIATCSDGQSFTLALSGTGIPNSVIDLKVPFKSQVKPGEWEKTNNCGQTSCLMMFGYFNNTIPGVQDIRDVDDWLFINVSGQSVNNYNGSKTNTDILLRLIKEYGGFEKSEVHTNWTSENLITELNNGYPVIVAVLNRMSSDINFGGHFMVLRGVDKNNFYFNDPGRSAESKKGNNISYSKSTFLSSWKTQNNTCITIHSEKEYGNGMEFGGIIVNFNIEADIHSGITLSWDAPYKLDPLRYNIYRQKMDVFLGEVPAEGNVFTDANVEVGTEYCYYITAIVKDEDDITIEWDASESICATLRQDILGDLSGDQILDTTDAVIALKMLSGMSVESIPLFI